MFDVIIYGTGVEYENYINLLKYYELINEFRVVGITSNEKYCSKIDDYIFYDKESIIKLKFDYCIIASKDRYKEIFDEVKKNGISEEKIIKIDALKIPNFSFEKYIKLKKSKISIIANNCWGGITYKYLAFKCFSPTINMFLTDNDYIKMLKNLKDYINKPLKLCDTGYNDDLKINYPICYLGDVKLYMNHYGDFKMAKNKWEERKQRINWNNLFIMMCTDNPSILKEFDELPYENKICFIPFKSNLKSAFYVDIYENTDLQRKHFFEIINGMANGSFKYYDVLDLFNGIKNCSRIKKL